MTRHPKRSHQQSWGADTSPFRVLQKLVQVLSDAYVILDWDDSTIQAKLAGTAAAAQHRPLTPAATLRVITEPPAVRRAALKLLATALQWGEFMCAPAAPSPACHLPSCCPGVLFT